MTDEEETVYVSANLCGYWTRVHGLELKDLLALQYDECEAVGLDKLHYSLSNWHDQEQFREGWEEADRELRTEKLQQLALDLHEAGTTGKKRKP